MTSLRFEAPRCLDEALCLLRDCPEATVWGGGTDLMVSLNYGRLAPVVGIGLRRLDELRLMTDGRVGSAVSFQQLERDRRYPALAEAARTVGSRQIRSMATLGGNLGTASPAGDSLPVLAAYGAQVVVRSHAGARTLAWEAFITGPRTNARRRDELIEAVLIPKTVPIRQAFGKVGVRNAMAISMVSACVTRAEDGATRVALGAVGPTVVRATRAEELASSEARPSKAALAEFARLVASEVSPITDQRATQDYRRHAAGILAKRQLMRCLC